jgi:hypothetical protein
VANSVALLPSALKPKIIALGIDDITRSMVGSASASAISLDHQEGTSVGGASEWLAGAGRAASTSANASSQSSSTGFRFRPRGLPSLTVASSRAVDCRSLARIASTRSPSVGTHALSGAR